MKKCSRCKKLKAVDAFIKNKDCVNGRAGICKQCANAYSRNWKRKNHVRLAKERRKRYAETNGVDVKRREEVRKAAYPLRVKCQRLRSGMRDRARHKKLEFDEAFFTVSYLMTRLKRNPYCQCCHQLLNIGSPTKAMFCDDSPSVDRVDSQKGYTKENTAILCWRCNKHKQDATADELRMIASFMDVWGNEVESDIELGGPQ